jgi:hypothetical protein
MSKAEKRWKEAKLREIIRANPYWLTYQELSDEFFRRHRIWLDRYELLSLGCQS